MEINCLNKQAVVSDLHIRPICQQRPHGIGALGMFRKWDCAIGQKRGMRAWLANRTDVQIGHNTSKHMICNEKCKFHFIACNENCWKTCSYQLLQCMQYKRQIHCWRSFSMHFGFMQRFWLVWKLLLKRRTLRTQGFVSSDEQAILFKWL